MGKPFQRFMTFLGRFGTFLVLAVLIEFLVFQYLELSHLNEQKRVASELDFVRDGLEGTLANNLSATKALALIIRRYGVPRDFDSVAMEILDSHPNIDAVELTKGGLVSHFYPLGANKEIIGEDILKDALRGGEAIKALEGKQLSLAGPVQLKTYGLVVIGRLPVFIDSRFYGFSVVIIRLSTLLKAAGIDKPDESPYYYKLSRIQPLSGEEEFFSTFPERTVAQNFIDVRIPGGKWRLSIESRDQKSVWLNYVLLSVFGLLFAAMGAIVIGRLTKLPIKLRRLLRKKNKEIESTEKYFRSLIEMSSDAVLLLNAERKVIYQSPAAERITGYPLQQRKLLTSEELIHPEDEKMLGALFSSLVKTEGKTASWVSRYKHKMGHYIWIGGTYSNLLQHESVKAIVCHFHDVTTKVEAERRASLTTRLYAFISSVNHTMIHTRDEMELLKNACQIAVDIGKFKMAWIGKVDESEKKVDPIMHAGNESNYLTRMVQIALDKDSLNSGPTGKAYITGKTTFCNDIANDEMMKPWAQEALARGYRSSIALPIRKEGVVSYALMLYADIPFYFDELEIKLLENVVLDISFALDTLGREELLAKTTQEIRKLSLVASSTDNPIAITDSEQRIEWVNESFIKSFGYSFDELVGKVPREFLSGRATDGSSLRKMGERLGKGLPASEEVLFYSKSGKPFYSLVRINPMFNDRGEIIHFVGVHTDLTNLKEYEKGILAMAKELSLLIQNANAIIFGLDIDGCVSEWNICAEELSGYTKDEVKGKTLISLLNDPINQATVSRMLSESLSGMLHHNREVSFFNRVGEKIILLLGTTPRRNSEGEIVGVMVVGQNISELTEYRTSLEKKVKERTKELHESLEKEKRLAQFKTRFVSMVSHEFRTPIAAISIAAEFVKRYRHRVEEVVVDEKLDTILLEIEHMTNLLEDTLMMGKSQEYSIRVKRKAVILGSFFQTLKTHIESAHGNSHRIQMVLSFVHPSWETDEGILRNIFINLIGNAMKYSPESEVVYLTARETINGYQFEIRDEGIGIPREKLDHLFEPFVRGANAENISGTGLGMSIVKKAVDILGGDIRCESILGEGTLFVVDLPFSTDAI